MASTTHTQGNRNLAGKVASDMEQPPEYQEVHPSPQDYHAPRVRDFQPPTPEILAREPDSDAESVLPSYNAAAGQTQWGNYRTEEQYLAALRAFVEEKGYVDGGVDGHGNSVGLIGFYGTKTGADYASQPGPWDGRKKKQSNKHRSDRHDAYAWLEDRSSVTSTVKASFWQRRGRARTDMR